MAWQLVVEVMDHAPAGLTVAERFLLAVIAEYVGRNPKLPARECECSTADLARRTGLRIDGVKDALRRLAKAGLDVRVPLIPGEDTKDGRPVYTFRGRVPRYRLPEFSAPDGCDCQACDGVASPTPSTVDGVGTPTSSDQKGWVPPTEGVGTTAGRGGPAHPPPVAGDPVAAAAAAPLPTPEPEDPIVAALARRLDVDYLSAARIAAEVERKRSPGNLGGYLRSMPDADLRAFLAPKERPAPRTASSKVPPPCGQCDARPKDSVAARVITVIVDGHERVRRCPRCHPARQEVSPDAA